LASWRKEEEETEEKKKKWRKKNERKDMRTSLRIGKGRKAEKRNLLADHRFFFAFSFCHCSILHRPTAFTVDGIVHHPHR
jgi:hypothetical protein